MLPVIHIDKLAQDLGVERRWILDNWIDRRDPDDGVGPAPHFHDGKSWFFHVGELDQWAKRRALASGCTDIPTDLSD